MNLWTSDDITKILIQLDEMKMPFSKYALSQEDGQLKVLGRGGFAIVYQAQVRDSKKQKFALKVIGFRNQNVDSTFFNESVQAQREIGDYQDYVVKIYDHTEIWVTLDDKDHVLSAVKEKPEVVSRTTIKLQFVLMEEISPVITRIKNENIKMLPESLAHGDEQEILRLAYDIGSALKRAHDKNILHRDVKLENVFYSEKKKQYKLGDFGLAKKTEDGFAGTVVFTKGYAAPEVRASDRYDNTADIYSFGMMLYVLANHLKFPDSNTYNVNPGIQYSDGYVVPKPECDISTDLYDVIAKACMYDPDDRYQSMEDMLLDIEKVMYGTTLGWKKEYKKSSLVVGTVMLAMGVVAWKLMMAPDLIITFSFWEYLFFLMCFGKGLQKIFKKDVTVLSIGILGIGIYLMAKLGFSWIKLILLICMTFSAGTVSGFLAAGAFIINLISLLQQMGEINWHLYQEYRWIVFVLIPSAAFLLHQYSLLTMVDRKLANWNYKNKLYWISMPVAYAALFVLGKLVESTAQDMCKKIIGNTMTSFLCSFELEKIGLYGLGFWLFWIGREYFLMHRQKGNIE